MSHPCPFCGIATDEPHETQQACIDALQSEIARTRGILDNSTRPGDVPPTLAEPREPQKDAKTDD
jgi:hypothetical protein